MNAVQVLEGAIALLDKSEKWAQGEFGLLGGHSAPLSDATCFCVLGAMSKAQGLSGWTINPAGLYYVEEAVKSMFPERVNFAGKPTVPAFNDHPDTTYDDVIDVLNTALDAAKADLPAPVTAAGYKPVHGGYPGCV